MVFKRTHTLHTSTGEIEVEAENIDELRSELKRRLAGGEFEKEATAKRWLPVSTHGNGLLGRVDLRDKTMFGLEQFGQRGWGSGTPPYVIHTTRGDVNTAAWSVHEFRIELARVLDVGGIPKFDAAPNMGRSRTVTQGKRRVGWVDWTTGEFTPTDKTEEVTYWVRHAAGQFPTEANDIYALRDELTALTKIGAFLQSAQGYWLEIADPRGVVERRVAAYAQEYREDAVVLPYTVCRAHDLPLKCRAKETGELGIELGTLLQEGEFQTEEDCRCRWLPVVQGDYLVGHVDPAERRFVPEEKRKVRYRIGEGGVVVPIAADSIEGLRAELEARWEDLRYLLPKTAVRRRTSGIGEGQGGNPVFDARCEGRRVGLVVDDGRFLLSNNDEDGPDGTSCESCRYWRFREEMPVRDYVTDPIETVVNQGQCRRWSPHPRHGWPVTTCNSWCGEYRSKPESG